LERRRIAVIRIRGRVNVPREIRRTLNLLKLKRKNNCVVLENRPEILGMIRKVENYVTWGEINKETMELLLRKRGRIGKKKRLTEEFLKEKFGKGMKEIVEDFMNFKVELKDIGINQVFRLTPPSKGFEKKGIKKSFKEGGALGYRGGKINSLIERMV